MKKNYIHAWGISFYVLLLLNALSCEQNAMYSPDWASIQANPHSEYTIEPSIEIFGKRAQRLSVGQLRESIPFLFGGITWIENNKNMFDALSLTLGEVDYLEKKADLVVCFEVIEHVHDPLLFVKVVRKMVAPGGIAIFTGLGVDGFDIQVLWENSKSIFPPHHINFISINGFHKLFKQAGFSEIEVITPGKLDVDIAFNNQEFLANENRFIKTLLSRGEEALSEFQSFLARHQLSSHCWILASN